MKKALLALAIAATLSGYACAQTTVYWDTNATTAGSGGPSPNGTWSTSVANWNSASDGTGAVSNWTTNAAGNNPQFSAGTDATSPYTVTISGTVNVNTMRLEEGPTVTFNGGIINFVHAAGTNSILTGILTGVPTSAIINSQINGTNGFKIGRNLGLSDVITISNTSNAFSGGATIGLDNTLKLGASEVIPDGNLVTISSGGTFNLNGFTETVKSITSSGSISAASSTLIVNAPAGETYSGVMSGASGALTKNGSGTLILSGANTNTGTTTISAGVLQIGAAGATGQLSNTSGAVTNNGSLVFNRTGTLTHSGAISGTGSVTVNGGVELTLSSGSNTFNGGVTLTNGTLRAGATNAWGASNSAVSIAGGTALSVNSGTARTQTYAYTANGDFTLGQAANGTGVLTMAGTLDLGGATRKITLANAADTISAAVSNGGMTVNAGTGTLTLNSGTSSYAGGTTVSSGTVIWNNNAALGTSTVTMNDANTGASNTALYRNAAGTLANNIVVSNSGTGTATIGNDTGAAGNTDTYSGSITLNKGASFKSGAGALVKLTGAIDGTGSANIIGTGVVEMTNSNTYSGGTTVTSGALNADNTTGSATGSGAVVVNSGGTLAGTGAVSGAVTVNTGGNLSPGNANTESLAVGALSLAAGSTFVYEINSSLSFAAGADLVNVALTGSSVLTTTGAGVTLSVNDLNPTPVPYANKFTLLSYNANNAPIGTFAGRPEGSLVTIGVTNYTIHYADVSPGVNFDAPIAGSGFNYVTLVAVPEARAFLLVGLVCVVVGAAKGGRKLFAVATA